MHRQQERSGNSEQDRAPILTGRPWRPRQLATGCFVGLSWYSSVSNLGSCVGCQARSCNQSHKTLAIGKRNWSHLLRNGDGNQIKSLHKRVSHRKWHRSVEGEEPVDKYSTVSAMYPSVHGQVSPPSPSASPRVILLRSPLDRQPGKQDMASASGKPCQLGWESCRGRGKTQKLVSQPS